MDVEKTDYLQEVVGCENQGANLELLRQKTMDFGYVSPGQQIQERMQGEKQASSTSASSSSGAGARVLKKQRTDDGDELLAPRCLFPGEETVSDERMRAAQAEAAAATGAQRPRPQAPAPPQQAQEMDLWDELGGMLDGNLDRLGG